MVSMMTRLGRRDDVVVVIRGRRTSITTCFWIGFLLHFLDWDIVVISECSARVAVVVDVDSTIGVIAGAALLQLSCRLLKSWSDATFSSRCHNSIAVFQCRSAYGCRNMPCSFCRTFSCWFRIIRCPASVRIVKFSNSTFTHTYKCRLTRTLRWSNDVVIYKSSVTSYY